MSIAVALEDLATEVQRRGFGYLITVGDEGRPHVVALVPELIGRVMHFDAGGRTCRNVETRSAVCVVFPPAGHDDFSLVVDGEGRVDGTTVAVTPTWAVRHRPAP